MSTTFELPNGGSATLRDAAAITERQRRPVTRLQMRLAGSAVGQLLSVKDKVSDEQFEADMRALMGTPDYDLLDELNDAIVVALVEKVTLPNGVDGVVTKETLLDLPGPVYDALRDECAKRQTDLLPSFAATGDTDSPTSPSVS